MTRCDLMMHSKLVVEIKGSAFFFRFGGKWFSWAIGAFVGLQRGSVMREQSSLYHSSWRELRCSHASREKCNKCLLKSCLSPCLDAQFLIYVVLLPVFVIFSRSFWLPAPPWCHCCIDNPVFQPFSCQIVFVLCEVQSSDKSLLPIPKDTTLGFFPIMQVSHVWANQAANSWIVCLRCLTISVTTYQ